MRTSLKVVVFGAALALSAAIASPAAAQRGTRASDADRTARREAMKERRDAAIQKRENMTPEQKAAFKAQATAYREKRTALMADVKAGKIDRKTAAEQLKAWRESNRPAKP